MVARVQEAYYRMLALLMCISPIIEYFFCLCARNFLLIATFAYVQVSHYWSIFLLVYSCVIIGLDLYNKGIVEWISCSRAKSFLLISPIAYVQIDDVTCLCADPILLIWTSTDVQRPTY